MKYNKSYLKFQFHKGTIKTYARLHVSVALTYFNSIKVRLKLPSGDDAFRHADEFQFHKGTIKTYTIRKVYASNIISIP